MYKRKYDELIQEYAVKTTMLGHAVKKVGELELEVKKLELLKIEKRGILKGLNVLLPFFQIEDLVLLIIDYCIIHRISIASVDDITLSITNYNNNVHKWQKFTNDFPEYENLDLIILKNPIDLEPIDYCYYQKLLFDIELQSKKNQYSKCASTNTIVMNDFMSVGNDHNLLLIRSFGVLNSIVFKNE